MDNERARHRRAPLSRGTALLAAGSAVGSRRRRARRRCRAHCQRRPAVPVQPSGQAVHRVLHRDHRHLPRLGRADPGRAGRHCRLGPAGGKPGQGHDDGKPGHAGAGGREGRGGRPSVVADRYIQLMPAYTGGPQLPDGATIPLSRTAVPAEVDQIYASLNKLAADLGPSGVNRHGALSNLIKTGAANLSGNGQYLNGMISHYSALSKDLGANSGNLFATIGYLQRFTSMLKNNDGQVREAEQQLAEVSSFLAADRQDLAGAISNLATALTQVKGFIESNRGLIKKNVGSLATLTRLLVLERGSLAEALDTVPLAADNVVAAYDSATHTLDGRGDLNELCLGSDAAKLGCTAAASSASATGVTTAALGSGLPAGAIPAEGASGLPPLPLPAVGLYATPQALLAGGSSGSHSAGGHR